MLAGRGRSIMGLFADVTVSEKHKDEMTITEHPTDIGSPISDHAYKEPPEVQIKVGWSESAGKLNGMVGNTVIGGRTGLVIVYEALQALQSQAIPLIVLTGKRLYTNMLIKSLECTTEMQTENVLMIDITFKKVFRAQAKESSVLVDNQATPEATAMPSDSGTVQAKPANESILSSFLRGIFG